MDEERIARVAEEAARILKDYPHMKYREAVENAREVLESELSNRNQAS